MDPDEHDRIVALTSHLPHLLAFALSAAAADWPDGFAELISTGFTGATRLAESDPAAVAGFLSANAKEVSAAAARFGGALDDLLDALDDAPALERLLEGARTAHRAIAPRTDS